jgi:hypothetical protein
MSTTIRLRTDTKQHRIDTAEFSTQVWRWRSELEASAQCALCGQWVLTHRLQHGGEPMRWAEALTGTMLTHFELDHHFDSHHTTTKRNMS